MALTPHERQELFSKIFVQEFTREFLFLSDVVAGRANRKGEFTDKLLDVIAKIPIPDGIASQVVTVATKLTSYLHEKSASGRIEHIGGLTDVVDPQALRIVLEQVARVAYLRHELFIQTRLTDKPEEGLIPFAKCAVERTLEYLASNRLELSEANLIAGLIEGRSGAFVSGWFNTKLPSREAYKNLKFSAEGAYARSGFRTSEGQYFIRTEPKQVDTRFGSVKGFFKSFRQYGYTDIIEGTREAKYGFALVPTTLVEHYDYKPFRPTPKAQKELAENPSTSLDVDREFIEKYLKQLRSPNPIRRLVDYAKQTEEIEILERVNCHADLSGLTFEGCDLSDTDFSGALFSGVMNGVNFKNAVLTGASFVNASVTMAYFNGAHCEYLHASEVDFSGSDFTQADFSFSDFKGANLSQTNSAGAVWYKADLSAARTDRNLIAEQQAQTTQMMGEFARQKEEMAQIETEISAQQVQLQAHTKDIQALLSELPQLKEEQAKKNGKILELEKQLQMLTQQQSNRLTFERYCKQELHSMNVRMKAFGEQQVQMQAQQTQMDDFKNQIETLQQNLSRSRSEPVPDFSAQLKAIKAEYPGLEQVCHSLEDSLGRFRADIREMVQSTDKRMNALSADVSKFKSEILERITHLEEEQRKLKARMGKVEKGQARVAQELDGVKRDVEAAKPEHTTPNKLEKLRQKLLGDEEITSELSVYIPVRAAYHIEDTVTFDLESKVKECFQKFRVMLLIGDSGSGKSTFNRFLVRQLWGNYKEGDAIPLFVSLPIFGNEGSRVIEDYLTMEGFTENEIAYLKDARKFIFVLDGYDEMNTFKNLYVSNHLENWDARILIACRTQHVSHLKGDHQKYFMPFHGEKALTKEFVEMTVVPFSDVQIDAYIQKYIDLHPDLQWRDLKTYRQHIQSIPGLRKLIETPFLLMIAMEVMPEIVEKYAYIQNEEERIKITGANLYDEFMAKWFKRQEDKLIAAGDMPNDGHDVKEDFLEYSKTLASEMAQHEVSVVKYVPRSSLFGQRGGTQWDKFFGNDDPDIVRSRRGAPIKKLGENLYGFIHASLIEYFSTTEIYIEVLGDNDGLMEAAASKKAKPAPSSAPKPWDAPRVVGTRGSGTGASAAVAAPLKGPVDRSGPPRSTPQEVPPSAIRLDVARSIEGKRSAVPAVKVNLVQTAGSQANATVAPSQAALMQSQGMFRNAGGSAPSAKPAASVAEMGQGIFEIEEVTPVEPPAKSAGCCVVL